MAFNVGKAIGNAGKAIGSTLVGDSQNAGILGLGQAKAKTHHVDKAAFAEDEEVKKRRADFASALQAAQARKAPTMQAATLGSASQMQAATIDQAQQAQFREGQQRLASQLEAQAAGQGPSLAQNQLQQGTNRNIAQAMALAASQRGLNAGAGLRQIGQLTAGANQLMAAQAADLRLQEQMSARQQLAGVLQGGREQDIGLATSQAGFQQQAGLANQDALNQFALQQAAMQQQAALQNQSAALQQGGMNDALTQFYQGGLVGMDNRAMGARMSLEELQVQQALGAAGINAEAYANASKRRGDFLAKIGEGMGAPGFAKPPGGAPPVPGAEGVAGGGTAGAATTAAPAAAAASDERVKKNVEDGTPKLQAFLKTLKPHAYDYKDEKHGEGKHVSPMAQEIEKTELGKGLVADTPEGKMVHYGKAGGVMLASAAMLNDKVESLEARLEKLFKSQRGAA